MESYQPFNPLSFSISARSKYCAIHTLLLAAVNFTGSQGQKPGGPHARGAAAKRSYPTSEVRGSGQECQAVKVQEWPKGYPMPKARGGGQEELPDAGD